MRRIEPRDRRPAARPCRPCSAPAHRLCRRGRKRLDRAAGDDLDQPRPDTERGELRVRAVDRRDPLELDRDRPIGVAADRERGWAARRRSAPAADAAAGNGEADCGAGQQSRPRPPCTLGRRRSISARSAPCLCTISRHSRSSNLLIALMLLSQPGPRPGQPLSQHHPGDAERRRGLLRRQPGEVDQFDSSALDLGQLRAAPDQLAAVALGVDPAASSSVSSTSSGRRRASRATASRPLRRLRAMPGKHVGGDPEQPRPGRAPSADRSCRTPRRRARTSPRSGRPPPAARHSAERSTPSPRRRCRGRPARIRRAPSPRGVPGLAALCRAESRSIMTLAPAAVLICALVVGFASSL